MNRLQRIAAAPLVVALKLMLCAVCIGAVLVAVAQRFAK